ncbi:MAG: hypothetical protein RIR09_2032, partial [Pseudomonadota bacterium]
MTAVGLRSMPPLLDTHFPATLGDVRTLSELFTWRVAQTPHANAYLQYDEATQSWSPITWETVATRVEQLAQSLARLPLPRGARIAILLPNGLDAVCFDQAALALACVAVPMHALDNPASIAYILADSDTSVLVAQTQEQWQAIVDTGVALPSLRQVLIVEKTAAAPPSDGTRSVLLMADWLAQAEPSPVATTHIGPAPDELATLVYTSGTTGKPKGVMLTHDNVLENVKATLQRVAPKPDDVFLSFLPLSHTFERTAGYYLPIAAGCAVAHARSVALLSEDMKTVRPTILISVPRIYERVYSVLQGMLADSAPKARLFA